MSDLAALRERAARQLKEIKAALPAYNAAPRAAVSFHRTEAAMVPGGWFGGWLGVVDYWNRRPSTVWGVTDGSPALFGEVGEFVTLEAPLTYSAGQQQQEISVGTLQPGDWDVWAFVIFPDITAAWFELTPVPNGFAGALWGSIAASNLGGNTTLLSPVCRALLSAPVSLVFTVATDANTAESTTLTVFARRRR